MQHSQLKTNFPLAHNRVCVCVGDDFSITGNKILVFSDTNENMIQYILFDILLRIFAYFIDFIFDRIYQLLLTNLIIFLTSSMIFYLYYSTKKDKPKFMELANFEPVKVR